MIEFVSLYSNQYNTLNEDVIKNIRLKDNMIEKLEETCKEIERNLGSFVEYLGYSYDDSKHRFKELAQNKKKGLTKSGKNDDTPYININPSYTRMVVFKFRIDYDGKQIVNMPIYIPLFIDDYHYYIRGNKYAVPYQLTDAITYLGKDDSVVLKTMNRAIKISREKVVLNDVHGDMYQSHNFYVHINNKKISMLIYHFSYFGFMRTLQYFGADNYIKLYKDSPIEPDESQIFFKYGKVFLGVSREDFETNILLRQFVATILLTGRKNLDEKMIQKTLHWKTILGSVVSDKKATEKGSSLLWTFIIALDQRTSDNIMRIVGGSEKTTSFAVLRWMFMRYSTLSNKNTSLGNKRLRLSEYLVTPFIRDIYSKLYRFLNTPINMRDKKRLLDVFKVPSTIILNAIIGKIKNKRQALNIAKYSSHVNDLALLNVALKYTSSGPGTPIEKSGKRAGNMFRQFDPTYVGNICITTTSAGDPGIASLLSPFAEVDKDTLIFKSI